MKRSYFYLSLLVWVGMWASTSGCQAPAIEEAWHVVVVCSEGFEGDKLKCSPSLRRELFDRWVERAIGKRGSTFSVLVPGDTRQGYEVVMREVVPRRWGSSVMQKKQRFIEEARKKATTDARLLPDGWQPSNGPIDDNDLAVNSRHTEVYILSVSSVVRVLTGNAAEGEPHHVALLCDRSDSTLGLSCSNDALRRAYAEWLYHGGTAPGSSFVVRGLGKSRDTADIIFRIKTPDLPFGERVAYLVGALRELGRLSTVTEGGSAIVEALNVAVLEDLEGLRGKRSLWLFSDLRQVTPGVWNFEEAVPSPSIFLKWLKAEGLLVKVEGIGIRVCGLHNLRGPNAPEFSAKDARRLRELWRAVLGEMGWPDPEITGRCFEDLPGGPI